MFKKYALVKILSAGLLFTSIVACEKGINDEIVTPPAEIKFTTPVSVVGKYFITSDPNTMFLIPFGFTTVSDKDRTVKFTYSSSTGAVRGTHYTAPESIVIPAGQVADTLELKGLFANFPTGVKHTVKVAISSQDAGLAYSDNTYTVELQKSCPVNITTLLGNYTKAYDFSNGATAADWGPYPSTITAKTPGVYGTKDTVIVSNFWDYGNPLELELDWTDAAALKTRVLDSYVYNHSTYGAVRAKERGTGTFSSCDQTFTINFSLYVSAGTFTTAYTTTLAR